jgi:hypothetical protein
MKLLEIAGTQTVEEFLNSHCKDFLSTVGEDAGTLLGGDEAKSLHLSLYRGINRGEKNSTSEEITLMIDGEERKCYIKNVRSDRKPLDTHPDISGIVDDVLKDKFGWKPRSQGIFCFGFAKRNFARDYGKMCKIYPMGEVKAVYSPQIFDLTPKLYRFIAAIGNVLGGNNLGAKGMTHTPEQLQVLKDSLPKFIEENNYSDDLRAAMEDGKSEIMVKCNRYLAVPID